MWRTRRPHPARSGRGRVTASLPGTTNRSRIFCAHWHVVFSVDIIGSMRLRQIAQVGGILFIFVLPLVCLCQLVPQPAAPAGPYLLLLPHAHAPADPGLTDDQLAEIAAATGQSVSISDDGELIIGYDDPALSQNSTVCSLRGHTPAEVAQNPVLTAIIPRLLAGGARVAFGLVPPGLSAGFASPYYPSPTRPPIAA